MRTMYMIDRSDLTIEEITVARVTKNTVTFYTGGATHPKDGWYRSFRHTFRQAKMVLKKIMQKRIEDAKEILEEVEEDMAKFKTLRRNHIVKR